MKDETRRVAGCIDRVIDGSGHQVDSTTSGRRTSSPSRCSRLYGPGDGRSERRDKMTAGRTNDALVPPARDVLAGEFPN